MSDAVRQRIAMLTDQQNHLAVTMHRHGEAINNQAKIIQELQAQVNHNHVGLMNIIKWVGDELGEEAVIRLREMLGLPIEKEPEDA